MAWKLQENNLSFPDIFFTMDTHTHAYTSKLQDLEGQWRTYCWCFRNPTRKTPGMKTNANHGIDYLHLNWLSQISSICSRDTPSPKHVTRAFHPESPPDPSQWIRILATILRKTLRAGSNCWTSQIKGGHQVCVFSVWSCRTNNMCRVGLWNSCVMHANMMICVCVCVFSKRFEITNMAQAIIMYHLLLNIIFLSTYPQHASMLLKPLKPSDLSASTLSHLPQNFSFIKGLSGQRSISHLLTHGFFGFVLGHLSTLPTTQRSKQTKHFNPKK